MDLRCWPLNASPMRHRPERQTTAQKQPDKRHAQLVTLRVANHQPRGRSRIMPRFLIGMIKNQVAAKEYNYPLGRIVCP